MVELLFDQCRISFLFPLRFLSEERTINYCERRTLAQAISMMKRGATFLTWKNIYKRWSFCHMDMLFRQK